MKKLSKAEKIFTGLLERAQKDEGMCFLPLYFNDIKYSKKLKLQIIEVAKKKGFNLRLGDSNNIIFDK